MGKLKPPKEVFDSWTPDQQAAYNDEVHAMEVDRDSHMASARKHEEAASDHERAAWAYQNSMNSDAGKHSPESKTGGEAGTLFRMYMLEDDAEEEHMAAAVEKAQADRLDSEINNLKIDENNSYDNLDKAREGYREEVLKEREREYDKLYELRKEQYAVQQELDDTWFLGKDALQSKIDDLQNQIDLIEASMAFNDKNLENTFPPPPTPPPPPPVAVPPVQTFVTLGAKLSCPLAIPCGASLIIDPSRKVLLGNKPMANIMDFTPMKCIPTMGQCTTMSNPAVAAATAAKLGVFTPAPCVPAIPAPWKPGHSTVLIENFPALLSTDTLQCMWGGVITILPG